MQPGESAGQQSQRQLGRAELLRAQAQELTERAQRAERAAEMWGRGQVGEQTVGVRLESLRPYGFDVLHDVRWPGRPRANVDHVAIGPPGILVVDAKNWSGRVTVRDGVLRQNGYRRERAVDGVRQAGHDVAGLLTLPWALHVIPVIALAARGVDGIHQSQGVTVVGEQDLVGWATGLPAQLSPDHVAGVAAELRARMPPASVPAPRGSARRASRHTPRRPSARARQRAARRERNRREALVRLGVLLLVLVLGPSLYSWWASHGDTLAGSVLPTPTVTATSRGTPSVFSRCADLRATYPSGVKRASASNIGKPNRGRPVIDGRTYRANAALDRDGDGVACERTRGASRPQR
jgi:hypothetical protein